MCFLVKRLNINAIVWRTKNKFNHLNNKGVTPYFEVTPFFFKLLFSLSLALNDEISHLF
jgi:hypothetical protein